MSGFNVSAHHVHIAVLFAESLRLSQHFVTSFSGGDLSDTHTMSLDFLKNAA